MLRKYTNVSGAPEIKTRRQSPVIGGARLYPGSTIIFNDMEWAALDDLTKRRLLVFTLMDPPILDYVECADPDQIKATALAAVSAPVVEDGEKPGEQTGESEEKPDDVLGAPSDKGPEKGELPPDKIIDETKAEKPEPKEITTEEIDRDLQKIADENAVDASQEKPSEDASQGKPSEDKFDYVGFLSKSVRIIKGELPAMDPMPNIVKLIEVEKTSESPRSSLIAWLEQHAS